MPKEWDLKDDIWEVNRQTLKTSKSFQKEDTNIIRMIKASCVKTVFKCDT